MDCEGESTNKFVASKENNDGTITKVFKSDFDAKYNILDISTPLNAFMSGQYKRSYAYYKLQNDLPVMLTKVVDSLTKDKNELVEKFGEIVREDLKIIIGLISRLKYELQTDKPFQTFTGDEPDRELWNSFIANLPDECRSFYKACWLHTECYTYRKLYSFVENSIFIKKFDQFAKIKECSLTSCQGELLSLTKYSRRTESNFETFNELLKINLWSNRNDISDDEDARQFNIRVLDDLNSTDDYILTNQAPNIWTCLSTRNKNKQYVDIVLDSAGYELFTDFILAEYLIEKGLADKVRFHVKAHPWFVTEATERDFHSTLQYLSKHPDYIISLIGNKFLEFLSNGKFELAALNYFWTAPYAFHRMRTVEPELYEMLQQSKLIIFKGDLNYRKLMGDVCWGPTQDIKTCLGGFVPAHMCAVRTIKSEVICGLSEGVIEDLIKRDPHWMMDGNYGVIQFVDGSREFGY